MLVMILYHYDNDEIIPVDSLDSDNQKIVIFDDFICKKNQKPLIDYFIQGRHKNCSVIYLSQSFYSTPKDIRLNCSHFIVYDFPIKKRKRHDIKRIKCNKKTNMKMQLKIHIPSVYVDKPKKIVKKNFYGNI